MKLILFLVPFLASAQTVFPVLGTPQNVGASGIAFVQANYGATNSATTSIATSAQTTNASDLMYVWSVMDTSCSNVGSSVVPNSWSISDTGSDTFTNILPNGTGYILLITITNSGSGYVTNPTMTVSGCSSNGAYVADTTGTTPNLVVSGYSQTTIASGCGPTRPTVSFSGGTPTTPATAVVSVLGIQATQCAAAFYCSSLAGTTNNVVTFYHPSFTFSALSIEEFSGVSTLDAEADAETTSSVSSVTSGSYTTTVNAEAAVFGSAMVNTGCSWTATTGWTLPAAGTPASGGGVYCLNSEYKILSSTVTGATTASAAGSKTAAMSGLLATFH